MNCFDSPKHCVADRCRFCEVCWKSVRRIVMRSLKIIAVSVCLNAISAHALELSDFFGGRGRNWNAIRVLEEGDAEMRAGNFRAARRDFDAAIRSDRTLWVAIYWRARLSVREGKWQETIRDCDQVLGQGTTLWEGGGYTR